jgi:hypothetical protein
MSPDPDGLQRKILPEPPLRRSIAEDPRSPIPGSRSSSKPNDTELNRSAKGAVGSSEWLGEAATRHLYLMLWQADSNWLNGSPPNCSKSG